MCIFEEDSCIGNVFFKFELSCCSGEVCESVDKAAVVGASTDACTEVRASFEDAAKPCFSALFISIIHH